MLATWIIYCLTLGVLISAVAYLVESIVRLYGGQTRRVWAVAMIASALIPAFAFVFGGGPSDGLGGGATATLFPGVWFFRAVEPVQETVDGLLGMIWIGFSALVALSFVASAVRVRLASQRWGATEVEGVAVLVSEDVGPAVIGALRTRIVMPRWALESDATARRLMLRHEEQHVVARDPQLVLFASAVLSVMPWNVPLWWMSKRLRLAVEVDCDRRVLCQDDCDVRTYGSLLVDVGRRKSGVVYTGAGFSWARSLLEHRILQMTAPSQDKRNLRTGGLLAASVMVLLTASAMPTPPSMQSLASGSWWCEVSGQADMDSSAEVPAELEWLSKG